MPKSINYSNFKGGLNEAKNPRTWDQTEASELMNVEFGTDGSLVKGKGWKKLNSIALNGGATITGVYEFILSTGASYLIACAGDKIYTSPDGNTFELAYTGITPNAFFQFVTFFDYAIMVNGADKPLIFDGGTVSVATWWTESHNPSIVTVWKNRLWMTGAPTAPYFVWYSAAGSGAGISFDPKPSSSGPFVGNPGGSIPINVNDGQKITGLETFANSLTVYKTKSTHQITGDAAIGLATGGVQEFSVAPVLQGKGCLSSRSLVNIYNEQFFIDETGINNLSAALSQNTNGNVITQSISNKVSKTISEWNGNELEKAFSVHYETKKQIWFIFPSGSSLKNDKVLIFDYSDDLLSNLGRTPARPWLLKSGFTASCGTFYKGKPLLGGYDGYLQLHDTTDSYDGEAIEAYWASSWLDFGNDAVTKHLINVDFTLEMLGNFNLTVDIAWDCKEPRKTLTINTKPQGAAIFGEAVYGTSLFSATQISTRRRTGGPLGWGKAVSIKIGNNAANQPFRILGFDMVYDTYGWQPQARTK